MTANTTTPFGEALLASVGLDFEPVCLKGHSGAIRRRIIASRAGLVNLDPVSDPENRIVKARLTGQHGDGDFVAIVARVGGRRNVQVLCGTLPAGTDAELNALPMIGDQMTTDERTNLNDGAEFNLSSGLGIVNVSA